MRVAPMPFLVIFDDGAATPGVDTYDDTPCRREFHDCRHRLNPRPVGLITNNHTAGMEYALVAGIAAGIVAQSR